MLTKITLASVALVLLSDHSAWAHRPRWVVDSDVLHGSRDSLSDRAMRFTQGAPNSTQPNTSRPPAGAAQRDNGILIAEGHDDRVRVSGQITSIKDNIVEIETELKGQKFKFTLAPDVAVTVADAATLADIKPGLGVGEGVDALEIFPPGTMSTSVVLENDGRKIRMGGPNNFKYEILIKPNVKVVRYEFGAKTDLVPGAGIYVELPKEMALDGSTNVLTVAVGRNGIRPTETLGRPRPQAPR